MSRISLAVLALVFVLALTTDAGSQMVDPCLSEASVSCPGMRVFICPANDGDDISDVCEGGYIEIWVRDYGGEGIPNIPMTDFWINSCDPQQELCLISPQPVVADSLTSELPAFRGRTTISGRIAGGGCVLTNGLWISVQGAVIEENYPLCDVVTCLDIVVLSSDITGDCRVSLSDFSMFANSYNKSLGQEGYNPCCDYTGDNAVTLLDFYLFRLHYQHP